MNPTVKEKIHNLVYSRKFELFIMFIILINCVAIGMETYGQRQVLTNINFVCLIIYTIEISLRFTVRESLKGFFTDGWNLFDLFVVVAGYIPDCRHQGSACIPDPQAVQNQSRTSSDYFRNDQIYESSDLQRHGNADFHVCFRHCRDLYVQTSFTGHCNT